MRRTLVFTLSAVSLAMSPLAVQKKAVAPPGTDLGLPFTPGIAAGEFLYLAGAIGNRPGTLEVPGDIRAQVKQTMENLTAVLKTAGMDLSHVVSANVFLSDARHFPAMNEVYRSYFPKDPPTRATVEADIAIPGALVEISMIAARPGVERNIISPEGMASPELPYSWGILAADTLFISGMTSRNPKTYEPVGGDIAAQTRQVLTNVGAVLEAAGMDYTHVTSCRVFLDDPRSFQQMNEVYRTFFPSDPPARATVEARLMNPAFLSEIQCVAVRDPERRVVAAEGARPSASPLSPAIQAGGRLFLSGMLGRGPEGYAPDVKTQTKLTLENLRATLRAAGMDWEDVVEATVYLTDIRHYDAMNEVYREIVPRPAPARATVGARLMAPDALVEISMTAAR